MVTEKKPLELKSFLIDTVEILEILRTPIIFNDWQIWRTKISTIGSGRI